MAIYTDIIKELRRDKKITQADMAKNFEIKQSLYSKYESGARLMRLEMLCKIADVLDTSTDYLLGRTDTPQPYPKR